MNFKELVAVLSSETGLPAGQVRKASLAMLEKFADLINSQTNFTSPVITVRACTSPAKHEAEGRPAKPERKYARITIRPQKNIAFDAE